MVMPNFIKDSLKPVNVVYLSLVALIFAAGTFAGLLKLMPESMPVRQAAPRSATLSTDSILRTSAAPARAQATAPIMSTVPLDTVRVTAKKYPVTVPQHKAAPAHHENHS